MRGGKKSSVKAPWVQPKMLLVLIWILSSCMAFSWQALAGEKWWENGRVDGYSPKEYLTAIGYGSTLSRAQKDAVRNLSSQLESNIRSHYRESSNRNGLSVSRHVKDVLSVKTHAKIYGLRNIRGRFVSSQGSYVAVVGVKRSDLSRYLKGRINNLRATIDSLDADLSSTSSTMRQIHDLAGLIRAKERASFFDRERAVITGETPSISYNIEKDLSRLESLLSRSMSVTVSLQNDCGGSDRFVRHVKEAIIEAVSRMGLLVVPSGGQIVIGGQVSARPMESSFSRRYKYYILHYALTIAAPDGTIWGSRIAENKVAALTPSQGELLSVHEISRRGVDPLVNALKSRLFLDPGDPQFVAFPSDGSNGASIALGRKSSSSPRICDDFRETLPTVASLPSASSTESSARPMREGMVRVLISSIPQGADVSIVGTNPYVRAMDPYQGVSIGTTFFATDLPVYRQETYGVDANNNAIRQVRWMPVVYDMCFSLRGFQRKCHRFLIQPGKVNRLETIRLDPLQ